MTNEELETVKEEIAALISDEMQLHPTTPDYENGFLHGLKQVKEHILEVWFNQRTA